MKYKNNVKLFFIIVIYSLGIFECTILAQTIPNQTLPNPEAYKFTQYGEIPVNESSGSAINNINVISFKAGKINVPIGFTHNGQGVRVDEGNSLVGVGWNLNVGGIITRVVNDRPDDYCYANERKFYQRSEIIGFHNNPGFEINEIAKGNIDTEVDIFSFNFGEYSGSFFFDENLKPRLIKYDKELKIEMLNFGVDYDDAKIITITTNEGTKYYFGGENASETTKITNGPNQQINFVQTGFYLYKIENIYGDIVNFIYQNTGGGGEVLSYSQNYRKDISTSLLGATPCYETGAADNLSSIVANYLHYLSKPLLKEITTNRDNSKISFNTERSGASTWKYYLKSIYYFLEGTTIHKSVRLNYLKPSDTFEKRFFIEDIEIHESSSGGTPDLKYSFEYYAPNLLPDRFSFSQDYHGYYNGKLNHSYVPKVNNPNFPFQQLLADKSSNPNLAIYGALKKIIYPTKGYSEFEYESPYKGEEDIIVNHNFETYYRDETRNYATLLTKTYYPGGLNQPYVLTQQKNINIGLNIMTKGSFTHHNNVKIEILKKSGSNWLVYQTNQKYITNTNAGTANYSENYAYTLPAGSYIFRLTLITTALNTDNSIVANASLAIPQGTRPVYHPGIRVKRILSNDNNGNIEKKRYYYNLLANKNNLTDSQVQIRIPNNVSDGMERKVCSYINNQGQSVCYGYEIYYLLINGDTQNNLYIGSNSIYEHVTVSYGGDAFENGGKQLTFYTEPNLPISNISSHTFNENISLKKESNFALKNGTLLREIVFKKAPTFDPITKEIISGKLKETINTYVTLPEKTYTITNCNSAKLYESPLCSDLLTQNETLYYIKNYYFGVYLTNSMWYTLESTNTIDYFDNGAVTNKTEYFYNSLLAGQPSKIKITGNDIKEIEYFYPPDRLDLSYANYLNYQFRINEPISTKEFNNGTLIKETLTEYASFPNAGFLPSGVKYSKGENQTLERLLKFNSYDSKGNLLEAQQENGILISYIWGYNKTLPVAKIENIAYSNIPPSIIESIETASNGYSEYQLSLQLQNLRTNLPVTTNITTYIYKPLVGISKITYPNEDVNTYHYDNAYRLEFIRDNAGNILKEYKYNFKQ